jgi:hypothetical protein
MKHRFRRWALFAILSCAWTPAAAQQAPAAADRPCDAEELRALAADPRRVSMAGGRVSLVPPEGLRVLTPDEIARWQLPEGNQLALGDDRGRIIRLGYLRGGLLEDERAREAYATTTEFAGRILGGFQWIDGGSFVEFGGARWLVFAYIARDEYVREYRTDFGAVTLVARFLTRVTRERATNEMANSAATLEVRDCRLTALVPTAAREPSQAPPATAARSCNPEELRALATDPRRVSIAGGRVSLVPPTGLPRFPKTAEDAAEEIAYLEPPGTSIIVALGGDYAPTMLRQVMEAMTKAFPTVKWINRGDMVERGRVRWQRVEYTANIVGTEQWTEFYVTSFQGQALTLSVTVIPTSSRARWQAALADSVASLVVHDCALAGGMGAGID